MEMTIQEVKQLDKDSYQIIDIRDDNEIAHGAIPGAVALKVEEIAENPLVDKSKKLVICCSRGKYSQEVVPELIAEKRHIFKGVSPNVDFYSGFVYTMLGIPKELFTPIFAIARIPGWSAHRLEEILNASKIIRPAYKYVGHHANFVPFEEREPEEGCEEVLRDLEKESPEQPEEQAETIEKEAPQDSTECPEEKK